MADLPHPDASAFKVRCAIVTVSDTRTPETDTSGQLIRDLLTAEGHLIQAYRLVKDEPETVRERVTHLSAEADAIILNGGTGIAPRDTTYDAIATLLTKQLPGFGELFRQLSYAEIGSRAMASRAAAGTYGSTLIFSLPGSSKAVKLAMERLILPELRHLVRLLVS
ncbi:MAG: MogA/MoaB family molybdenum cofactor biosynthesis protein [Cyanobacteria bacterium P01_A01_bin.114]